MVYISGGRVTTGSSPSWSVSSVPDLFWALINFIVLFFKTLVQPGLTKKGSNQSTDYRSDGRGGGPSPRMGGFRRGGGPNAPPMAGGG